MTGINTSSPLFPLYPTDVKFENPLVKIEILGTSEGGGEMNYILVIRPIERVRGYLMYMMSVRLSSETFSSIIR